jgi:hypothetical protein
MMATIRQSLEGRVTVCTAFHQPSRFEDYPRFMQEAGEVKQPDDTQPLNRGAMPQPRPGFQ